MYDETNVPGPEFRVRAVTRHVVTRYFHPYQSRDGKQGSTGSSEVVAEVASEQIAIDIASALADAQHGSVSV